MNTNYTHRGFPKAFTLIELLVVIAIIAILAAMILPILGKAFHRGNDTRNSTPQTTVTSPANSVVYTNLP